jgi:septal ring factor EnvC (AmiA/AmiB activator)
MQWAIALGLSADQTADFLSAAAAHKAAIQASNGSRTGAISDALAQVTQERDQLRIELACVRADLHDTAVQRDEVTAKASALSVQLSSIRAHFAEVVAELSKTNPSIVPLIKTGSALINDHGAHASVD